VAHFRVSLTIWWYAQGKPTQTEAGTEQGTDTKTGSSEEGGYKNAHAEKIAHLFTNITHLVNAMRPHQARQSLIGVLKKQISSRKQKLAYLRTCSEEAKQVLAKHDAVDRMSIDDGKQTEGDATVEKGSGTLQNRVDRNGADSKKGSGEHQLSAEFQKKVDDLITTLDAL
jgi:hypothetical protein